MNNQKIINIAVIAHVDAGKSTLVDALLKQSGIFRDNEVVVEQVMDSNDLERERGITIYSKNCSIVYNDYKINIVDTPGHADFSSEVERIIKTVDTVVLLVDASEGPMPQTRFVLSKSLELGLKPILLINKIDKKDQRAKEVINEVLELFMNLDANDEQLNFPYLFGVARNGIVQKTLEETGKDLSPLFETIISHCETYPIEKRNEPLQMQISSLAYDDYIGRLGIGRVFQGKLKAGQEVTLCRFDGTISKKQISQIFTYQGMKRVSVQEVQAGDIAIVAGISDLTIGETINEKDKPLAMPLIHIEAPTLSMNFLVNKSPFVGQSGKFVTSRNIKDRLDKELQVNVGLKVEAIEGIEGFKVSGRGELHLSILLENMRREGFELAISKPEVIFGNIDGKPTEPIEKLIITCPEEFSGTVINKLNLRKGQMEDIDIRNGTAKLIYSIPTRGLIGYKTDFTTDTRGEGVLVRRFERFEEYKGEILHRLNGVLIASEPGEAVGYGLFKLQDRGIFFISPQTQVYEGMIVGIHSRPNDLVVNVCREKKLTNTRSAGNDEGIKLTPPKRFSLEEALEFIENDELVELTPDAIRIRKKYLKENERKRDSKGLEQYQK